MEELCHAISDELLLDLDVHRRLSHSGNMGFHKGLPGSRERLVESINT